MPANAEALLVLKTLVALRRGLRAGRAERGTEPRLTVGQVQALLHLAMDGQPLSMSALAQQLGISYPSATELVERLVAAGRVERVFDSTDRRKTLVALTPEAREIAEAVLATRGDAVAAVLEQLTDDERRGFVRGLTLLAKSLATSAGVLLADFPLPSLEIAAAALW